MDRTQNLSLPYIMASQAQKHVTHNEALLGLDAIVQLAVLDRNRSLPPSAPAEGDRHIVASAPVGAWSGMANRIAAWQDGAWSFYAPKAGWSAYVMDTAVHATWTGSAWTDHASGGSLNPAPRVGVNAVADDLNRLTVKGPAALFLNDAGGHQLKISKAAVADTASVVFQKSFSGRAEIGLVGGDEFALKVSADGGGWVTALRADAAGRIAMPAAPAFRAELTTGDIAAPRSIPFNALVSETGSSFDAATGVFTIPAAGRYLFHSVALASASGTVELQILVNGASVAKARSVATALGTSVSVLYLGSLAAGDAVAVRLAQGSVYGSSGQGTGFTSFTGAFVG